MIDATLVARLAELAALELEPEEVLSLTADLQRIVEYVNVLSEADTSSLTAPTEAISALRADEPHASLAPELALAEAPRKQSGGFSVPAFVVEG